MIRAVIVTNVIFEGITDADSDSALGVEAWLTHLFVPCVSDALTYEDVDVLSRRLSPRRWLEAKHVLARLISEATFISMYFRWRPIAQDAGDDFIVDCAMNANACVVTHNTRDFAPAVKRLGLTTFAPDEFVERLASKV